MPLQNPLALLGLISIIPLIIIYLIQPRPKEILFSSILFLREGAAERSAVLSRLIKDPLFWVQLLFLISLSLAAAGPYTIAIGAADNHLAIILDVSASMEASLDQALTLIGPNTDKYNRISIVLADSIPITALQSGSSSEAKNILAKIYPRAVSADISGAMMLGNNLLASEGGDMLVVSDLISWIGDDPQNTRKLLERNGNVNIVFAVSNEGGDNLAVIDGWNMLELGDVNHTTLIRNYGPAKTIPISVSNQGGISSQTITLPQGKDHYFSFSATPGINQITLEVDDAIASDNIDYVYVPELETRNVLFVGEDSPALFALRALPNVRIYRSGDYSNFDLVVIANNASIDGKLNRYIDSGGNVVYIASSPRESPDYLPVKILGLSENSANLWVRSPLFAKNIHFNEIGLLNYLYANPRRHSTTLIEANGTPILSFWHLGKGTVVYDGLETNSDFYSRPEFPIFWYELVNWLTGIPELSQSNRKTGELIPFGSMEEVKTPLGIETTNNLLLDKEGVYEFQDELLVANMYDASESKLGPSANYARGEFNRTASKVTTIHNDLTPWFIAIALIAIIFELALIRWRQET